MQGATSTFTAPGPCTTQQQEDEPAAQAARLPDEMVRSAIARLSEEMVRSMSISIRGAALCSETLLHHIFRNIEPSAVGCTSRDLNVIVSDSALKTNSQKKSRYVTAAQVVSELPAPLDQSNVVVAVCPRKNLDDLCRVVECLAIMANITKLVVIWQGKEYAMNLNVVQDYVVSFSTKFSALADDLVFVAPAPSSVWPSYGPAYAAFAEAASSAVSLTVGNHPNASATRAFEFAGLPITRSHASLQAHDSVVKIAAGYVAFWLNFM